jgi:predicted nucleic acid-binding protein
MTTDKRLYDTRFFFDYFYSDDAELVKKLKQEAKSTKEKFVSALSIHELHHISMKRSGKEVAALRSHAIFAEFTVIDVNYAIAVQSAELRSAGNACGRQRNSSYSPSTRMHTNFRRPSYQGNP